MNKPEISQVICSEQLEEVTRVNKELEVVIESIYDGIILSDEKGRIFRANSSVERVSGGIKASDIIGKTAAELEDEGIIVSQSRKILGTNPLTLKQQLRTGVELLITSTRAYDDYGKFMFYVANLRDITELNRLKKEMEETKDLTERYYQELTELRDHMLRKDQIIFKSESMKQVCERVFKVAKTDTNILLTGPSGTGKEVIAKFIHNTSNRCSGPFVQINCGAIPETLLESELFGYDRGAFTGASRQGKMGLMEMANAGTILLDEIGDLPLGLQVKLLRAIQEQVIYRVGSTQPVQLDVRIIAATNRNLEEMVKAGTFREDLYYRLNVIPIYISPLADRPEDILPLAFSFLERYNRKHGTEKTFSVELCALLESYAWPGNVRELENLIERLVVITDGKTITRDCLPLHMQQACIRTPQESGECKRQPAQLLPLKKIRDEAEREVIDKALRICGSTRKAAEVLEVDHSTIVRKIKQLNITYPC